MTARYTSKTRRLSAGLPPRVAERRAAGRRPRRAAPWRMLSIASAAARFPSLRMGVGREHAEQRVERHAPAGHRQREVVVHEQAPAGASHRPLDSGGWLRRRCLAFVPGGGGAVQRRDRRRRDASQLEAQQIREQVVVAKPGTAGVERGDEGVRSSSRWRIASAPVPPVSASASGPLTRSRIDVRTQQVAHLRRLALQHLGEEVARHGPLAAGELGHEALRVGVRGQRDRRQPQTGRPALGAFVQRAPTPVSDRAISRLGAARRSRRARSEGRAPQLVNCPRPQAMQPEGRSSRGASTTRSDGGSRVSKLQPGERSLESSSCTSSITSTSSSSS